MGNEKENITKYLRDLDEFKLPAYNEFPPIPLYMEQVISYIGECLKTFSGNKEGDDNNILTPFMVNNYVKAKIITPPKEKKYSKEHLAYLLAIALLKSVVSMKDIATLIDLDSKLFEDKKNLYDLFKNIQEETLKKEVHKANVRVETLSKISKEKIQKGENDESIEDLNLAYVALKLYIEAETKKQIADTIMKEVTESNLSKTVIKESKKEASLNKKKETREVKKIRNR